MISFTRQAGFCAALALTAATWLAFSKADDATQPAGMMPVADFPKDYKGTPFTDSKYKDGAQKIPGKLMCAYYDLGGEGVAYHDTDAKNKGSGGLNPLDGKYLNEFRAKEGVDTSYTKDFADFWEGEAVKPPKDMLYVGWTEPGEWMNFTVDVAEDGAYTVDIPLHVQPGWSAFAGRQRQAARQADRHRIHQRREGSDRLAAVAPLEHQQGRSHPETLQGTQPPHPACRRARQYESRHLGFQVGEVVHGARRLQRSRPGVEGLPDPHSGGFTCGHSRTERLRP